MFYDLTVKVGNTCARTPVYTVIDANYHSCKKVGINNNQTKNDLLVFPNPFTSELNFYMKDLSNMNGFVKIMDGQGKIVNCMSFNQQDLITIDMSRLQSGLYFYSIQSGSKNFSGKIIK